MENGPENMMEALSEDKMTLDSHENTRDRKKASEACKGPERGKRDISNVGEM